MKIKNILMTALVLGGMASMSSCSGSFLDEDRNPNSLSPSVFWKNETDIMKGLTSAYAALQPNIDWAIPFERYIVIDNFRSDECDFRADVSSWMSIAMFTNESTSSVSKTEWTNLYTGVNFANQCIDNIPNVPGSAEIDGLKKQAIAEARFLRAFYYYRLYINFGEIIPIYLHQIEGTEKEFYPDQAKPGELVEFIENELKEVQSDLPEKYSEDQGAYPSNWLFEVMKQDKTSAGKYSDRTLSTIIFDDPDCRPSYYEDGKSFKDYHKAGEFFWHKFVNWDPSLSSDWYYSAFNFPIIRYADVLLLYAECLNDRGDTPNAIKYINQVRDRVHVPGLPLTMTKDQVLKHLQDVERPCELALEGSRWYDLIRWNIVGKALKEHNKPYVENFVEAKHKLFPIPHSEFLLNKDWEQNPNFSK